MGKILTALNEIKIINDVVEDISMYCNNLSALMEIQKNIIEKHIDAHKWLNGIENREEAMQDFIDKFAWLIRELYCGYVCEKRYRCKMAKEYVPEQYQEMLKVINRISRLK